MAKTNWTEKQPGKKQPSDCHCEETKNTGKAKSSKATKDCSDCK